MLYEVTLFQSYYGQSCINRFNYLMTGTPAAVQGSFGLISALGAIPAILDGLFPAGGLWRAIRDQQSDQVTFTATVAKAVYDVEDFYELPYVPAKAGNVSGEALSPVMAYGFRSNRTRTDIRRGTKRFVGVPEANVGGGGVLVGTGASGASFVAGKMTDPITYDDEGSTLTYSPVIVSKEEYTVPSSGNTAYRYYPTLIEQMEHVAQSILWQPYAQVRSQTSRQYGRGQ